MEAADKNQDKKRGRGLQHWQVIRIMLVVYDIIAVLFSYLFALWIRFDASISQIPKDYLDAYTYFIPFYTAFVIIVFICLKLYRNMWRYASVNMLIRITAATVLTGTVHIIGISMIFDRMPLTYYVGGVAMQYFLTLGIRFLYRVYHYIRWEVPRKSEANDKSKVNVPIEKTMLIGAGDCGRMITREFTRSEKVNAEIVCFIDDNPNKWNRFIENIPIVGGRESIKENVIKYGISRIIFAIPSASAKDKRDILNICNETGCRVQTVPGIYQFVNDEISLSKIKDINIEDLLGREPVVVDAKQILENLTNKVVMVTGGGGSIGSELCRQIASHNPKKLIIFDIYENNLYDIQQELRRNVPNLPLEAITGSIRDSRRLEQVFSIYRPEIVFHAAAHKHVPLMEDSPWEAIKNNAVGTYKTAFAAVTHGCKKFVLISTDKAVNPTNIMGASKRLCEMIIQTFARKIADGKASDLKRMALHTEGDDELFGGELEYADTQFAAVRFGNVLGSNGSVIPLFRKQIAEGGPVTVTHPEITRFFMTIPEAVSLVLQASAYAKNGEIFVLDMGEPVKILTLAKNLIRLSGFVPDEDIKIQFVGLRPGEKMYEEKLMDEEGMTMTENKLIHIGRPLEFDEDEFIVQLNGLLTAAYDHDEHIKEKVAEVVTTYTPE